MDKLTVFMRRLIDIANSNGDTQLTLQQARDTVKEINEFLFTNYEGIGTTFKLGEHLEYFSDFHKYWQDNYIKILDIKINDAQCEKVAISLHEIWKKTDGKAFWEIYDTGGIGKDDICRIRFLTANQDFRGSRDFGKLADLFLSDKSIFDERRVFEDPELFIKTIGITGLSQNDKRVQYAKHIAKVLIEHDTTPIELIDKFERSVLDFRKAISEYAGSGYGFKKADMFIRDMVVLGVWEDIKDFDKIDVASDVNTIKIALRTGIIKSKIPLLSSFLDFFSYQYDYVDEMNAKGWRRVWEHWYRMYPDECIDSPCLMDYFIYKVIGKQFCKEILCYFRCASNKHEFKWHSSRNQTCQVCYKNGFRNIKANLIGKTLPCLDEDGSIAIQATDFVRQNPSMADIQHCPFKNICMENNSSFLQPPKSISIRGQTGWTTAYARRDGGGGGLMA